MRLKPLARMTKRDRGLVLIAGAMLFLLLCAVIAQVPPPSDANSFGSPDRNIEKENCYCHRNSQTGTEPDENVEIVFINPPNKMVTNGTATLTINILYPDADSDTRYGYAVDLDSGDDKKLDGAALKAPHGTPSENMTHLAQTSPLSENVINLTITAPSKAQSLKVTFMGIVADNDGTESGDHWNTWTHTIDVHKRRDISINATIKNKGDIEAKDVNVTFLVDGEVIGNEFIPVIPPNEEFNVTHMWDATFFDAGEYKIEIIIDPEQKNLELDENNNRISKTIVLKVDDVKEDEYNWQTIVYYILGAVIILIIIGILYKRFG